MRVVIAGGGIAALEVLAGLYALAGNRVTPTLVAPVASFSFSPLSTAVPYTFRGERTRSLAAVASELGARFVQDGLVHVDEGRHRILTRDGDFLTYDALVVALGARTRHGGGPTRTWSRGPEGTSRFAHLLQDLESGAARTVAVVVPSGAAWPVDAYELAFVASLAARRANTQAEVLLVTAEESPLEVFGPAVGQAVADELARAGIEVITGVDASRGDAVDGHGAGDADPVVLQLTPRSPRRVDRALFLPVVEGPAIAGLPHDGGGFIPVDAHGRVVGARHCFAAGDATSLSLKHSALSASQATAAAEAIAAEAGADVVPTEWSSVLHGLLTLPPHFPGPSRSPWLENGEPVTHCLWWPPGHVAGRHLAPYLASSDRGVRPGLGWHPNGLPVAVEVGGNDGTAMTPAAAPSDEAIRRDVLLRQMTAIRRIERDGTRLGHELERRRSEFVRHERETIRQLEAAGYLHDAPAPER
jgi:sulfide:quinone oxidoreductase